MFLTLIPIHLKIGEKELEVVPGFVPFQGFVPLLYPSACIVTLMHADGWNASSGSSVGMHMHTSACMNVKMDTHACRVSLGRVVDVHLHASACMCIHKCAYACRCVHMDDDMVE